MTETHFRGQDLQCKMPASGYVAEQTTWQFFMQNFGLQNFYLAESGSIYLQVTRIRLHSFIRTSSQAPRGLGSHTPKTICAIASLLWKFQEYSCISLLRISKRLGRAAPECVQKVRYKTNVRVHLHPQEAYIPDLWSYKAVFTELPKRNCHSRQKRRHYNLYVDCDMGEWNHNTSLRDLG